MKIIDQGKLKLNTSKAVAIDRFSQLQDSCSYGPDNARIGLFCNKNDGFCIRYYKTKYNGKYSRILSQLNAKVITENGETYVSYYTSMNNSRIILVCGALISTLILCLLYNLFWGISIPFLIAAVACIIALITQVSSIQNEKNSPYANSKIYVDALKKYTDAVNNWEI